MTNTTAVFSNPLTVLYYQPGKDVERVTIENDLEPMQKLVGGHIEFVRLFDEVGLVCNEEGKIFDLPVNRVVGGDAIVGNFFVAGGRGSEFADLTDQQTEKVLSLMEAGRPR